PGSARIASGTGSRSARGKAPGRLQVMHRTVGSIDAVQSAFAGERYVADRDLATAVYLSLALDRPLLLEGEAGVGKTEVGRTLAAVLKTELIRLQCYEGLDVNTAVYEWDYARQMPVIRLLGARGGPRRAER